MVVFYKKYKQLILQGFLLLLPFILNGQNMRVLDSLQTEFEEVLYLDFNRAEKIGFELEKLSKTSNNTDFEILAYHNLTRLYLMKKDYVLAKSFVEKFKTINEKGIPIRYKIDFYNYIAYLENNDLNYNSSIKYSEKALKLALQKNDSVKIGETFLNKSKILIGQQEFEKAKNHLQNSRSFLKVNMDTKTWEDIYFSYGRLHYLRDKDSALFYFNKALESAKASDNRYRQSEIYSDMAFTHIYHEESQNAKDLLDKSLALTKQVGHDNLLHNIFYTYGLYYETIGEYESAIKNYKIAIDDHGEFLNPVQLSNAYIMMSSAHYHNESFKQAYDYQEKFLLIRDSIFNVKKMKEFENIRVQHQVERKDNQIKLLEKETELAATKRNWIISSAILVAVILASLFLFYRNRAKMQYKFRTQEKELHSKETERLKKEQKLKQIQGYIEGQEKEKNRIALELHDGIASELAGVHHFLSAMDDENKNDKLKSISKEVSRLANNVRRLSHNLSAHYTKDKSLLQLLSELKYNYEHTEPFTIDITIFPPNDFNRISFNVKHQLYRIIQELLKNVSKHAEATKVSISLTHYEKDISLIFEDNGKGGVKEQMAEGIGLKNIKERIAGLEGTVHIETSAKSGTNIIIQIPNGND